MTIASALQALFRATENGVGRRMWSLTVTSFVGIRPMSIALRSGVDLVAVAAAGQAVRWQTNSVRTIAMTGGITTSPSR